MRTSSCLTYIYLPLYIIPQAVSNVFNAVSSVSNCAEPLYAQFVTLPNGLGPHCPYHIQCPSFYFENNNRAIKIKL